jgi:hypothetical protein
MCKVAFLISIFCSDPESHWCDHFGSLPLPLAFDESSHVKLRIRPPVVFRERKPTSTAWNLIRYDGTTILDNEKRMGLLRHLAYFAGTFQPVFPLRFGKRQVQQSKFRSDHPSPLRLAFFAMCHHCKPFVFALEPYDFERIHQPLVCRMHHSMTRF